VTTRIRGLTIALTHDIREDDVDCLVSAIKQFKNVLSVNMIENMHNDWIAEERIKRELSQKLWDVLNK